MKIKVKKVNETTTQLYDENGSIVGFFNPNDFFIVTENRVLAEYLYKSGEYEFVGVTGSAGSVAFVFAQKENKRKKNEE
jgi:hypothetical protein